MSITVSKDKGVTVVTVVSDSESVLPPLCQILKRLCYSPVCCSVHQGLMQPSAVSALGTIQIMVGLFAIGLGPGRISQYPGDFTHVGAAYWLGGVYIAVGILSLLTGRFPSICSVGLAVFMNILGVVFSIVGIVLYAIDLRDADARRMCEWMWYLNNSNDNCKYVAYLAQRLLTGMDITMIVLAVLQLCVCISFAVLGIKALLSRRQREGDGDDEVYQPMLNTDISVSPDA